MVAAGVYPVEINASVVRHKNEGGAPIAILNDGNEPEFTTNATCCQQDICQGNLQDLPE